MEYFSYGSKELDHLRKRDRKLGRAIDEIGPIEREVSPDLFVALIGSILSQQISAKAAITVKNCMVDRFGAIEPGRIASVPVEEIQQCGMSMRKAGYIKNIGKEVAGKRLDLAALTNLPDIDIINRLTTLNGVGVWTAEMLLIFSLQRPDIVSWNDLAIRRGMMKLYNKETLDRKQFDRYRRRYSPCGSVASLYLWELSHR